MTQTYIGAQIAQLIATPKLPAESAAMRFKNMLGRHYIATRVRSETDKRGTLLFSPGDAATAAILSNLMDLGGLSKEAMQAAALRLGMWNFGETEGDPTDPESPAAWMLSKVTANPDTPPGFTLRISWQRHTSGTVNVRASLSHGDHGEVGRGFTMLKDHVPLADLVIPLDGILLDLSARIARMAVSH